MTRAAASIRSAGRHSGLCAELSQRTLRIRRVPGYRDMIDIAFCPPSSMQLRSAESAVVPRHGLAATIIPVVRPAGLPVAGAEEAHIWAAEYVSRRTAADRALMRDT